MQSLYIVDIIGSIGVFFIVIAYFLLQIETLSSKSFTFSLLNAVGSVMILYSLSYNWNFASVLIESFWVLISLFGLYKYFKRRYIRVRR